MLTGLKLERLLLRMSVKKLQIDQYLIGLCHYDNFWWLTGYMDILQGSVATPLRCSGIFNDDCIADVLIRAPVKIDQCLTGCEK